MSKRIFVVFRNNDAEVFVNQKPSGIKKGDIVFENPDLSRVRGISPHYWKLVGDNLIFPMNIAERSVKNATHRKHYRSFKGYHWGRILGRMAFSLGLIVLGGIICYYLTKKGILK